MSTWSWRGPKVGSLVRGAGVGAEWSITRMEAELAGVTAVGAGAFGADGRVSGEAELSVADPGLTVAFFEPWAPDLADLGIGGGPIGARCGWTVRWPIPKLVVDLTWSQPAAAGHEYREDLRSGDGGREVIEWASEVEVESGLTLEARGTAHPLEGSVAADWTFSISDLGRMAQYLPADAVGALHGQSRGDRVVGVVGGRLPIEWPRSTAATLAMNSSPCRASRPRSRSIRAPSSSKT